MFQFNRTENVDKPAQSTGVGYFYISLLLTITNTSIGHLNKHNDKITLSNNF